MSNIFAGVVSTGSGTIPGLVPTDLANLTDGDISTVTSIPNQVVSGPATYHGYWTMDLGEPGTVTTVQYYGYAGVGVAVSLESSTDGVGWDVVVSGADFNAAATGDISDVSAVANNVGRRYWRLHYQHFVPGLGSLGGVTIRELSVLVGGLALAAAFSGTPLTGVATLAVAFTDESTGSPTSWSWDFGDGGTSTSQNPTHNYTAAGTYTVSLTATNMDGSDTLTRTDYVVVTDPPPDPVPGGHVEFDDEFVDISDDIIEWTITRGASPELTGGSSPGSATIVLKNLSDQYNPENTGGPNYGFLHDGPRVWIGVNEDGTVAPDPDKDVYGLFAGRITELSLIPVGGADMAPTAEMVCEDPLGWFGRAQVVIPPATTRSQYDLRVAVLDQLDPTGLRDLAVEPATLPLSSADGLGLNILDSINAANGTRHFAKPADNFTDWYRYTTIRRTSRLDGSSEAGIDAGSEHLTDTSGWRVSADGIINRQKASVEPITFPTPRLVWEADDLPLTVTTTPQDIWVDFADYVEDLVVDVANTGSTLGTALTAFGTTAKLTLTSVGTSVVTSLSIRGRLVQRGSTVSVVIDDAASQALARGVRAGPDLSGDYLGTITSAQGFAAHIVWRFANSLYRPTMTVKNWLPTQFDLDLYDRISVTIAEISIAARIFEVVGLTHHGVIAAADEDGNPRAVLHEVTYTLQESRVQSDPGWFILDDSLLDGTDVLAY